MGLMKLHSLFALSVMASVLALSGSIANAKDEPISVEECPPPVQAVIRQYSAQGTFEKVEMDRKKKSGGPVMYEAKFLLKDGKRVEVHIDASGKVLHIENKKPKI